MSVKARTRFDIRPSVKLVGKAVARGVARGVAKAGRRFRGLGQ